MKKIHALFAIAALCVFTLFACKKDKDGKKEEKPLVNPASTFTVEADGQTYNMKVIAINVQAGDTAQLILKGDSPEYVVTLNSKSIDHNNGVGDYYLYCCNNDVFEYGNGRKHWEGDHTGGRQEGFVKITRMDATGYAGTYSISTKDGSNRDAQTKTFTGAFNIIY
jgi:hypothetical protein